MIPKELKLLVERQPGAIHRSNLEAVNHALLELGVDMEGEFAVFFRCYVIAFFNSCVSDEELCDLLEPSPEIALGTKFVHEVWELPKKYICLTSIQGEGAYLYDRDTEEVFDFDLSSREVFIFEGSSKKWRGFFDFMIWYLSEK